jgi:hypothetical protein
MLKKLYSRLRTDFDRGVVIENEKFMQMDRSRVVSNRFGSAVVGKG